MVLVTGGAGLVGTELIDQLLASNRKVRAIYNRNVPIGELEGLEKLQCSILDVPGLEDAMEGVDEVYHCAGLVSFTPGNSSELYKINVEGTANIVNVSLDAGIRKMVHVSSVSALGRIKGTVTTEQMPWVSGSGNSKYGQSKFLGEMEVWRGIAEGLDAVIINPSIILGAGNWNEGSTGIFKTVHEEFGWYTDGVRGFVDVRDVASIMIMLMESDITAERFIVSACNEEFRELFKKIAFAFNKKPPSKKATPFLASLLWRYKSLQAAITGRTSLLSKETTATAFVKEYFDNSKLLRALPSFAYRSIDETIAHTCNALQQKVNIQ